MPIKNYYFDEINEEFVICDANCEYCVGGTPNDCLKCSNNLLYLMKSELNYKIINSKTYEYSKCDVCNLNNYLYYSNYNFDDLSTKVCLDDSSSQCPESFPFRYQYDYNDNACFQNCKNTGTIDIYGNTKNNYCIDECDQDIFLYDNNTCVEDDICPEGYYFYALRKYCISKCDNNLYHVKEEREDVDNGKYFELKCESTCPINDIPYYFVDGENNRYCLPSCNNFDYYYGNEIQEKYDIYYKNTLICYSKSQCNNFRDEYSSKKYVALINSTETQKRYCVVECKEVSQYLLPQSLIDISSIFNRYRKHKRIRR